MKKTLLAAMLLITTNVFADFSETIIGLENETQDKAFYNTNQQSLHSGTNEIILTFDDGPTPGVTNKVLDILKDHGVKGTFFVVAKNAQMYPDLMKRIHREGHIVANHSLSHKPLRDTTSSNWKKNLYNEIFGAHEILAPYMTGKHFYFRAPEGAWDKKYAGFLNSTGTGLKYIGPIFWDIGGDVAKNNKGQYLRAADWACWSKKISVDNCLAGYLYEARSKRGGVVLMHDIRQKSAEMLQRFIPSLKQNGFTFTTLDDVDWANR